MLRTLLEQVSNHTTPEENIRQVALLAKIHVHTITPLPSKHALQSYTCLVHALDFTGKRAYLDIAEKHPFDVFAGAQFAEWLLHSKVLEEVDLANAAIGDLVWYYPSGISFKNVGLWQGDMRVESKWGDLGLFEHPLWEVPASYGTELRIFKSLPYGIAIQHFLDFERACR